jgi:hypothetical protein
MPVSQPPLLPVAQEDVFDPEAEGGRDVER